MPTAPEGYWKDYADHNIGFSQWLEKVDEICHRFLGLSYANIEHELEAFDCWEAEMSPETFVKDGVIPYLRSEHGDGIIDAQIGAEVMWGSAAWPT